MTERHPEIEDRTVDAAFPLRGTAIPLDHGYPLLGAVARIAPVLHEAKGWGIHPVFGERQGDTLALTSQSRLKIRLPASRVGQILDLAGKSLDIDGHPCRLGFPEIRPLVPAPSLKARVVTIKGFVEPEPFAAALQRQIVALPGLGQPAEQVEVFLGPRRVLRVKHNKIRGFAVGLTGLDANASLAVQKEGLGGRRHMGAGVFVPPPRVVRISM